MIELSADLGEGSEREDEIWPLIDAANVACGGHTGDRVSMRAAAALARRHGVVLGAHPSYPDREGFGRRSLVIPREALLETLRDQIAGLAACGEEAGVRLERVKPHGALYNDAHRDAALAALVVEAIRAVDPLLAIVCASSSRMASAAADAGTPVVREAFADRLYEPDGSLASRAVPGSLLTVADAAAQALLLTREGVVVSRGGSRLRVDFDTLCIHADMEGAVERLARIRRVLLP